MSVDLAPIESERVLRQRCERALAAAARSVCGTTRQQARAAARHFVRGHRGDAGYLRFVLRSVLASASIGVALLGFAPQAAHAAATYFVIDSGVPVSGPG